MPKINAISTAAVLILMMSATPSPAQETEAPEQAGPKPTETLTWQQVEAEVASLEQQSTQAYKDENYVHHYGANINLLKLRPYEPEYMQRIIAACALVDRKQTAFYYMMKMQKQGLSYDLSLNPDMENIRNTEIFKYLNNLMVEAGQAMGAGQVFSTLTGDHTDSAAISWDDSRNSLLVGTQSKGAIIALNEEGASEVLIEANDETGLWAIKGLHADSKSNRLWVSSASVPGFSAYQPHEKGRGALFEFNLETLELIDRFNVPVDGYQHEPGPIAVSAAGDVYLIDHASSVVYRKAADSKKLEVFVGSLMLGALQDIAVTPDNSRLYISDLYKGVLVVDPAERRSVMLSGPEELNLGGIRGLSHVAGKLVIVQSGFQPERLMQLELDASGGNIVNFTPLASALAEFDRPASSAIHGNHVYYFANSESENIDGAKKSVFVMYSPLVEESEMPVDMQKFLERKDSGS